MRKLVSAVFAVCGGGLPAQSPSNAAPPAVVGCYQVALVEWSRPLGVNAAYHTIPSLIRLDTTAAPRGGWLLSPDIAYPGGSRASSPPRWIVARDTVEMQWSTGFQSTTLRGVRRPNGDFIGRGDIWSDAHEFGASPPQATVIARRVACPPGK